MDGALDRSECLRRERRLQAAAAHGVQGDVPELEGHVEQPCACGPRPAQRRRHLHRSVQHLEPRCAGDIRGRPGAGQDGADHRMGRGEPLQHDAQVGSLDGGGAGGGR